MAPLTSADPCCLQQRRINISLGLRCHIQNININNFYTLGQDLGIRDRVERDCQKEIRFSQRFLQPPNIYVTQRDKLDMWMTGAVCQNRSIQVKIQQISSKVILIQFTSTPLSKWISTDIGGEDLDDSNNDIDINMDFQSWIIHQVFLIATGLSS